MSYLSTLMTSLFASLCPHLYSQIFSIQQTLLYCAVEEVELSYQNTDFVILNIQHHSKVLSLSREFLSILHSIGIKKYSIIQCTGFMVDQGTNIMQTLKRQYHLRYIFYRIQHLRLFTCICLHKKGGRYDGIRYLPIFWALIR